MAKLIKFKDTDFLHASTRIRSMEKKLLNRRQLVQMTETPSLEEAYKIANDAGIGAGIPVEDFELALIENLDETYAFLESLVEGHDFLRLLRYEYDALNLKTLIKAHAMGKDPDGLLTGLGSVPADTIREEFRLGKYALTPRLLAEAAGEAADALARTNDPQVADIILDKAMLAAMLEKTLEYDIKLLKSFVRMKIDLSNIKSMVRICRIGKDIDFWKRVVSPGGNIDTGAMIDAFAKGMDSITALIEGTQYADLLEACLPELRAGGPLTDFERLCDDCQIKLMDKTRLIPFGVEVLVVYAVAKDMELRAVRIVLASRLAGVAPQLIKERLRETYA